MAFSQPLKAKDVSIRVTGLDENGTAGTAVSLVGKAGEASFRHINEVERFDADDAGGADRDKTKDDWEVSLNEVIRLAGDTLDDIKETYDKVRIDIQWPRVGEASTRTKSYVGVIITHEWQKRVGKNENQLTIQRCAWLDPDTGEELDNPLIDDAGFEAF